MGGEWGARGFKEICSQGGREEKGKEEAGEGGREGGREGGGHCLAGAKKFEDV
jgi:hypothetical protein